MVFYSAARLPGSLVQVLNQTLIPSTAPRTQPHLSNVFERACEMPDSVRVAAYFCSMAGKNAAPGSLGAWNSPSIVELFFFQTCVKGFVKGFVKFSDHLKQPRFCSAVFFCGADMIFCRSQVSRLLDMQPIPSTAKTVCLFMFCLLFII